MDEKMMDLLGKILENQTETNNQLKELNFRVRVIETKVENDIGHKIKALFEAREIQNEKNDTIIGALERIETKVKTIQIETAHVRKVK